VHELPSALAPEPVVWDGSLREWKGRCRSGAAGRMRSRVLWCGSDRDELLGGKGETLLSNFTARCSSCLRHRLRAKFESELLILPLKSCSIVAIVSVLERKRFNAQSFYIEGKPGGIAFAVPGSGQGTPFRPAARISGRVCWELEYMRTKGEHSSHFSTPKFVVLLKLPMGG
jgi:hypothetical protein